MTPNENGFFSIREKKLSLTTRLAFRSEFFLLRASSFPALPQTTLLIGHIGLERRFEAVECPGLWTVQPCWEAEFLQRLLTRAKLV